MKILKNSLKEIDGAGAVAFMVYNLADRRAHIAEACRSVSGPRAKGGQNDQKKNL